VLALGAQQKMSVVARAKVSTGSPSAQVGLGSPSAAKVSSESPAAAKMSSGSPSAQVKAHARPQAYWARAVMDRQQCRDCQRPAVHMLS